MSDEQTRLKRALKLKNRVFKEMREDPQFRLKRVENKKPKSKLSRKEIEDALEEYERIYENDE